MSDPTDLPIFDLDDLKIVEMGNKSTLRVIKTARTEKAINKAADEGFYPLVKRLEPSPEIRSQFAVFQEKETGKIEVAGDLRMGPDRGYECVLDFHFYYPHRFESPFAAYLIPKDIAAGERVLIEDLIEDYVGGHWQGNAFRLKSCEAIWNGKEFELQLPEDEEFILG